MARRKPEDVVKRWCREALFDLRKGIELVYTDLFILRLERRLDELDAVLASVQPEEFHTSVLIAILTVTAACARSLGHRAPLYQAALKRAGPGPLLGLACVED